MNYFKLIIVYFFLIIQLINVQGELDIDFLDIDSVVINQEYITGFEAYINDQNNGAFLNMTILKPFPQTSTFNYELVGATMGEYIVKTGIKYSMIFCDVFKPEYRFLGDQLKMIGMKEEDCPPSPNLYGNENVIFDLSCIPDSFRRNQYVAIITVNSGLTTILDCRIYFRIY